MSPPMLLVGASYLLSSSVKTVHMSPSWVMVSYIIFLAESIAEYFLGTMGLSAFYGKPKPDEERFQVLDKLYASGELFWDSADVYMDSEDLLGK